MTLFDSEYADYYDAAHAGKNYASEVDLIEELFAMYSRRPVASVLDLGCGTGNHTVELVGRGYDLVCVDRSLPMLKIAREKTQHARPLLIAGDIRSLCLRSRFEAVLMMFAVLSYQLSDSDVEQSVRTAREHLSEGGVFIFDVWYGPAVRTIGPGETCRTIMGAGGRVLRRASGRLDDAANICEVEIRLERKPLVPMRNRVAAVTETHRLRYFFPDELDNLLSRHSFNLRVLASFPNMQAPDESTWNVMAVAQAV